MPRIALVRPGAGSPELLSLEQWRALTTGRVFATVGDDLGEHLAASGYAIEWLAPERSAETSTSLAGKNLLGHAHGEVSDEARARAERLVSLSKQHGEIAFILRDEDVLRATMQRALEDGLEVEFVIGAAPRGHRLLELVKVMAKLRAPGGCPWDAEQTHQTLAKHLLDETYELLDAIDSGDEVHIAEELGDLLLQVVFHAQMGDDARAFDIDDVAQTLIDKLVRRHPHVFGDVVVEGAREVVHNWDQIKREEKQRESALDGIPDALPALAYAQKMQRRAAADGFDWPTLEAMLDNLSTEIAEFGNAATQAEREDEFGDVLFSLVAIGRHLEIDAESALRRAARTFRGRFEQVERLAKERATALSEMSEAELDALWQQAKAGS